MKKKYKDIQKALLEELDEANLDWLKSLFSDKPKPNASSGVGRGFARANLDLPIDVTPPEKYTPGQLDLFPDEPDSIRRKSLEDYFEEYSELLMVPHKLTNQQYDRLHKLQLMLPQDLKDKAQKIKYSNVTQPVPSNYNLDFSAKPAETPDASVPDEPEEEPADPMMSITKKFERELAALEKKALTNTGLSPFEKTRFRQLKSILSESTSYKGIYDKWQNHIKGVL